MPDRHQGAAVARGEHEVPAAFAEGDEHIKCSSTCWRWHSRGNSTRVGRSVCPDLNWRTDPASDAPTSGKGCVAPRRGAGQDPELARMQPVPHQDGGPIGRTVWPSSRKATHDSRHS